MLPIREHLCHIWWGALLQGHLVGDWIQIVKSQLRPVAYLMVAFDEFQRSLGLNLANSSDTKAQYVRHPDISIYTA